MTSHSHSSPVSDNMLAILAGEAKRIRAGDASSSEDVAWYQAIAIDALLLEAAASATSQVSPAICGEVRAMVSAVRRNFIDRYVSSGADQTAKAAGHRFGLMAAIAEVGVRFGVFPWETGEIYRAAGSMFEAWQRSDGGSKPPKPPAPTMPAPNQSVVSVTGEVPCSETGPEIRAGTGHSIKRMGFLGSADLAAVLDGMGRPDAVTIAMVIGAISASDDGLRTLLTDRRHRRTTPVRFAECGYERVRNADATDGLWSTRSGKRVPVYARTDRREADRLAAVRQVFDSIPPSTAPIGGVGEPSLDDHGGKNA